LTPNPLFAVNASNFKELSRHMLLLIVVVTAIQIFGVSFTYRCYCRQNRPMTTWEKYLKQNKSQTIAKLLQDSRVKM
ncbi:unnamed protein product, partial [Ceratitis capitata]